MVKSRNSGDDFRIVLVSMPFGPLFTPSIALGLLASTLRDRGYRADVLYFTIPFARRIGVQLYELISSGGPEGTLLLGDWLFRDALFEPASPAANADYRALLQAALERRRDADSARRWRTMAELDRDIAAIRREIDDFLCECTSAILDTRPDFVGFTSVFQQNVASLALARRLKQLSPEIRIVFGGANCEGDMGRQLLSSFPQVDFVVSGEGEQAVLDVIAQAGQENSPRMLVSAAAPLPLNKLPYPEYDSFFDQVRTLPDVEARARLLFESSRGCWWGERSHCTFCGLNGSSLAFRSKSPERVLTELDWMIDRYPGHAVSVVDNILDLRYFETLLPQLAERPRSAELFYEVKANLRKAQVQQLRAANITRIQPGIESLHDGVLALMKKGVTAVQNIQLLKWCSELGVEPLWNFIWGFPEEDPGWYEEMADLVPLLTHLPPPGGGSEIRLDRFSPLFDNPALGAAGKAVYPAYHFVYAEIAAAERDNLAYHFTFSYADERSVESYAEPLNSAIERWRSTSERCAFFTLESGGQLILFDLRHPEEIRLLLLDDIDAALYRICDEARTAAAAHRALAMPDISLVECEERLERMAGSGLMVAIRSKYLSLAIAANERIPSAAALERLQEHLVSNGEQAAGDQTRIELTPLSAAGARRAEDEPPHLMERELALS